MIFSHTAGRSEALSSNQRIVGLLYPSSLGNIMQEYESKTTVAATKKYSLFLCCAVSWNSKRFNYPLVSPKCLATRVTGQQSTSVRLVGLVLKSQTIGGKLKQQRQTKWQANRPGPTCSPPISSNPSELGQRPPNTHNGQESAPRPPVYWLLWSHLEEQTQ